MGKGFEGGRSKVVRETESSDLKISRDDASGGIDSITRHA